MLEARPGALVLEDGRRFEGELLGGEARGEVVFTTVMTGYPEVVTDPSYRDQIVVMCFPEIGIYGHRKEELESAGPQPAALVVRQIFDRDVGSGSIVKYLSDAGRPILSGIDTRSLVRHLRSSGTLLGEIVEGASDGCFESASSETMIRSVATPIPVTVADGDGPVLVVVDYGVKADILRSLSSLHASVRLVPPTTGAADIAALRPDAVILSPGPGDPAELVDWTKEVRKIAEAHPTFGICLGHQLLAQAFGAATFKLKFGHRGGNHPVREDVTARVRITSQNHGYAVDEASLAGSGFTVTHQNANDGTIEGLAHRELPVRSLQYHPEAGPGPRDERPAFARVLREIGVDVHA